MSRLDQALFMATCSHEEFDLLSTDNGFGLTPPEKACRICGLHFIEGREQRGLAKAAYNLGFNEASTLSREKQDTK